jgi:hypothetical protein
MKMIIKILCAAIILIPLSVSGQEKIKFKYDENGNRLSKTITIEPLVNETVKFPITDQRTLKSGTTINDLNSEKTLPSVSENIISKNTDAVLNSDVLDDSNDLIVTNVYPNPGKDVVKISISNLPYNSKVEIKLYDLNGNQLLHEKNLNSHTELNISMYKNGIYVLRIFVNNKVFDWKVVKENY